MTRGAPSPSRPATTLDSLPYGFWNRLRDRRNGRRDGRLASPKHEAEDLRTAYWQGLDTRARELYAREEKALMDAEIKPLMTRYPVALLEGQQAATELSTAQPELELASSRYSKARDYLNRLERNSRVPEAEMVSAIREAQATRREFETAQAVVKRLKDIRAARDRELADLKARIPPLMENLNKQLWRIYHHIAARQNVYAQALLAAHPFRSKIEDRLKQLTPPPPMMAPVQPNAEGQWQIEASHASDNSQE